MEFLSEFVNMVTFTFDLLDHKMALQVTLAIWNLCIKFEPCNIFRT